MRHCLVREFVKKGCEEIHSSVGDEEHAPGSGRRRWEVFVELCVEVQFVLHKSCQMRAQYTRFVSWCPRSVVADCGIFAECHTRANDLVEVRGNSRPKEQIPYLLRHILHVLLD